LSAHRIVDSIITIFIDHEAAAVAAAAADLSFKPPQKFLSRYTSQPKLCQLMAGKANQFVIRPSVLQYNWRCVGLCHSVVCFNDSKQ